MDRRSNKTHGFVKFPINSKEYISTKEGGLSVVLVVIPAEDFFTKDQVCCGPLAHTFMGETYIRDDTRPKPDFKNYQDESDFNTYYEEYHFPRINSKSKMDVYDKYVSRPYLAVAYMGSTGWSGYSEKTKDCWHCTYKDLTPKGRELYDLYKDLYPNAELILQTWLDT